jgi:hypothetical protein
MPSFAFAARPFVKQTMSLSKRVARAASQVKPCLSDPRCQPIRISASTTRLPSDWQATLRFQWPAKRRIACDVWPYRSVKKHGNVAHWLPGPTCQAGVAASPADEHSQSAHAVIRNPASLHAIHRCGRHRDDSMSARLGKRDLDAIRPAAQSRTCETGPDTEHSTRDPLSHRAVSRAHPADASARR